ncbi:hypothetical protein E8E11_009584 [Didymella keratinophila]|nr:hypothetical protein E8E11_009584 [Didymella keratinophila]
MSDFEKQYEGTGPRAASMKSDEIERQLGEVDPVYEAKLVRKLDAFIIPVVMLLYLLSFLDRVNIGNARLYGLEEDLGMDSTQFQTAVSILFVTYILSEVPSNLVLKKLRPSRWIAFITVSWGIIATLTGVVQTYGGLIACRLLLGAVEGGLFPGMAVYLTFFYTKRELALRIGYLFVSAALAGACGGLLAYAIGHMDGIAGQRGWRWIMILEGIPTFILGIATWWILPDSPETAYFLSADEKAYAAARLKRQTGYTKRAAEFHWEDVRKCFKDWKVWLFCFAQFGSDTMLYGFSTFLPTIIRAIMPKASSAMVQVLTIPCYALGAITYLVVAHFSDKQQKRAFYSILMGVLYPAKEGPRFIKGHAVTMAMVAFAIACYAILWAYLGMLNSKRDKGEEDHLMAGKSEEEIAEMGDESPRFRYTI